MVEDKINNLFEAAISKGELAKFIVGDGEYFLLDREIDGHWPLGSYKKFIEDYLKKHNGVFEEKIWNCLVTEFSQSVDKNVFLDMLIGYLIPYYNPDDLAIIKKGQKKLQCTL